jgi:diaminopimelate decarboxylase
LAGLHVHIGTQVTTTKAYADAVKLLVRVMCKLGKSGAHFEYLDIGGGFPSKGLQPVASLQPVPDIGEYAKVIGKTLTTETKAAGIERPQLIIEPGRILVNNAVSLLLKVIDVKTQGPLDDWLIVDGGINLVAEYLYKRDIRLVGKGGPSTEYNIAGPLCMQIDILGVGVTIPKTRPGAFLLLPDVGAYSLSLSQQFIRPRPAVVLIHDGKVELVRRPETTDDILKLDAW